MLHCLRTYKAICRWCVIKTCTHWGLPDNDTAYALGHSRQFALFLLKVFSNDSVSFLFQLFLCTLLSKRSWQHYPVSEQYKLFHLHDCNFNSSLSGFISVTSHIGKSLFIYFYIHFFYLSDTINPRYILNLGECLHFDLIQSRICVLIAKHHTSEMLAWSKRYQPDSIMVQTINSTKNNNYQHSSPSFEKCYKH